MKLSEKITFYDHVRLLSGSDEIFEQIWTSFSSNSASLNIFKVIKLQELVGVIFKAKKVHYII